MITTATALVLALTSRIRTSAVFDSPAKYAPSSGFTPRTHPLPRGYGNSCFFARSVVCHVCRIAIGDRGRRKAVAPKTEPCTASCCLHATTAGATIVAPIASAPATSSRQLLHGRSNGACEGAAAAFAAAWPSTAAAACDCRLRLIVHRCSDVLHESFAAKWLGCTSRHIPRSQTTFLRVLAAELRWRTTVPCCRELRAPLHVIFAQRMPDALQKCFDFGTYSPGCVAYTWAVKFLPCTMPVGTLVATTAAQTIPLMPR